MIQQLISEQVEEVLSLVRNPYLTNNNGLNEVENEDRIEENLEDRRKIARKVRTALTDTVTAVLNDLKENGVVDETEGGLRLNTFKEGHKSGMQDARKHTLDYIDKV